jgi:transposase
VVPEPFGIVRMSAYTAKLNGIDPQAWVADVLARIADHNIHSLDQLLPWNWKAPPARLAA